jgi:hypothetical protein
MSALVAANMAGCRYTASNTTAEGSGSMALSTGIFMVYLMIATPVLLLALYRLIKYAPCKRRQLTEEEEAFRIKMTRK